MTVDRRLLEILVCPITRVPVKALSKERLSALNRQVAQGAVKHLDGTTVEGALGEALITDDGRTVYRVEDGIPVMLEDQAIPTEQLEDW